MRDIALLCIAIVGNVVLSTDVIAADCSPTDVKCELGVGPYPDNRRMPRILSQSGNRVPVCVTPERLMLFVHQRYRVRMERENPRAREFAELAKFYRALGDKYKIRWDYAFFQMMAETGHLSFTVEQKDSRGHVKWAEGTVRPEQFNFAGLGATKEAPKGESFASIELGVDAHLKHLLVYSGTAVMPPMAKRTCEVQADLLKCARSRRKPVTFTDMTAMWSHKSVEDDYAFTMKSGIACEYAKQHNCPALCK